MKTQDALATQNQTEQSCRPLAAVRRAIATAGRHATEAAELGAERFSAWILEQKPLLIISSSC